MNRNLDGVYFRVKRNEKWENICFSDLTEDEMKEVMTGRSKEWLKSLCIILGQVIRRIAINLILSVEGRKRVNEILFVFFPRYSDLVGYEWKC